MNTIVGIIISNRQFVCMVLILSLFAACSPGQQQLKDIPIVVSESEAQTTDINLVITNAQKEVKEILPNADLTFFSLIAKCESLSELKGDIHLHFRQTRLTLFGERVFAARVVVDTIQQKFRMQVQDETEQYLSTEKLELNGLSTLEIARVLETYLASVGKCDDTVVLTRVSTNARWYVRCGPPEKVFAECIEIDPESGDITILR